MLARLAQLSPRAKAIMVAAIVILTPLAGWLGYNVGYWIGHN